MNTRTHARTHARTHTHRAMKLGYGSVSTESITDHVTVDLHGLRHLPLGNGQAQMHAGLLCVASRKRFRYSIAGRTSISDCNIISAAGRLIQKARLHQAGEDLDVQLQSEVLALSKCRAAAICLS